MVEVDSTYYGMPSERNSSLWVERTPDDFTFNVKAFRLFTTHQTPPQALPRNIREGLSTEVTGKKNLYYKDLPSESKDRLWQMFEGALLPLSEAGKLGVVVFQFPPWFMPRKESYQHIEECKRRLPNCQLAVELRSRYWFEDDNAEEVLSFLRSNNISYVAVDEPQGFKSSVPPIADVTGDYAVIRFHGRNKETWERRGLTSASQRYDYYYERAELEEWEPKVRMMQENAKEVHLVMNTNYQDQGIANARLLGLILEET